MVTSAFCRSWYARKKNSGQARAALQRRPRLRLEELESRTLLSGGLVAAYNFNEGSGAVLNDLSGNGNAGQVSNATWTTGKYGMALSFNGKNSLVNITDASSLDLTAGMSLEAWVKPTTRYGWGDVIGKEMTGGLSYSLYASDGGVPGAFVSTGTGADQGARARSSLKTNSWSHLAGTFDGALVKLYVNGALVSSRAVTGTILTSAGVLRLGGNSIWGEYFTGLIDEVRIYNVALTQAQIQTDMKTPISTPAPAAPLTATFNNGGAVVEGSSGSVLFASAAGGSGAYVYSYDFNNDGSFEVASSTSASAAVPTTYLADGAGARIVHGRISDSQGAFKDYTTTITITNAAPTANPGGPYSGVAGMAISFLGSATDPSSVDTSAGFSYLWNFGDNTTSAQQTPGHAYTSAGAYTVTLTVTDKDGASSSASVSASVAPAPIVNPVVTGPANQAATQGVASVVSLGSFSDAGTGSSPWNVAVNWGDGTTANFQTSSQGALSGTHAFASAGVFTIAITVTNARGGSGSASGSITVAAPTGPLDPTATFIVTPYDKIPNFGANPTIVSVHSGAWSDPTTWSLGRLPALGDVVSIADATVTYDVSSTDTLKTVVIQNGGHLLFATNVNTTLTLVNLLVLEGGELQIGTPTNPVAANVKSQVIFANQVLDTAADPEQYGNGLIALGKVTMHGSVKDDTFVMLATEPRAGDLTLTLAQPVTGWQAGDRLILPDTRQLSDADLNNFVGQWEQLVLAGVSTDGRTLTLSQALAFDHFGARDGSGTLRYMAHVGNLTRNVVVRSQSSTGTRGHVLFTGAAAVDVRYTQFSGLGRTTIASIDNTTIDSAGAVTHVGANQDDRFPIDFRHVTGPVGGVNGGYSFSFVGNAVFCPITPMNFKWGIAIDATNAGLVQDNVLYNWGGAGVVTVRSTESRNVIDHNFVVRITGNGASRADSGMVAREGSAFWFAGTDNFITSNVAANADFMGYTFMGGGPFLKFADNQTYGGRSGITMWYINGADTNSPNRSAPQSAIERFVAWHMWEFGVGKGYPTFNVTFDGMVVLGDPSVLRGTGWDFGDYRIRNVIIQNADIEGMRCGIMAPTVTETPFVIRNSYLASYTNIIVSTMWTSGGSGITLAPREVDIQNVRFGTVAGRTLRDDNGQAIPQRAIDMVFNPANDGKNWVQLDQVFVTDFNGVHGDDFQVFYVEQRANAILAPSTYTAAGDIINVGSPEEGLTNAQAWAKYGVAFAGALAPDDATTRDGIGGLVKPM